MQLAWARRQLGATNSHPIATAKTIISRTVELIPLCILRFLFNTVTGGPG